MALELELDALSQLYKDPLLRRETPQKKALRKKAQNYLLDANWSAQVPGFSSPWKAAFRETNLLHTFDLFALDAAFDRVEEPAFDLEAVLEKDPVGARYPELFEDADSMAEYMWIRAKALREQKDRALLNKMGMNGFGMQLVMGLLSPEILMPAGSLGGVAKAGYTAGKIGASMARPIVTGGMKTAGWTALASAVYEVPDYFAKETKGLDQVVLGIGTATVLGGVIGTGVSGAAGLVGKRAANRVKKAAEETDKTGTLDPFLKEETVLYGEGDSSLARDIEIEPGIFKTVIRKLTGKDIDLFLKFSPNLRLINQRNSPTMSVIAARLDAGGLSLLDRETKERFISEGGTVWQLKKDWMGRLDNFRISSLREAKRSMRKRGVKIGNHFVQNKNLSRMMYNALWEKSPHPEVNKMADDFKSIVQHMIKEVRRYEQKWKPEEDVEDVTDHTFQRFRDLTDDEILAAFTRFPAWDKINQDRNGFATILKEHLVERETARLLKKADEHGEEIEKLTEEVNLRLTTMDAAEVFYEAIDKELKELPGELGLEDVLKAINEMKQEMWRAEPDSPARLKLKNRIEELKKEYADEFGAYDLKKKEIRGRLRELAKTSAGVMRARMKDIDALEKLQATSTKRMEVFAGKAHLFLSRLDKYTEEVQEREFEDLLQRYRDLASDMWIDAEGDTVDKVGKVVKKAVGDLKKGPEKKWLEAIEATERRINKMSSIRERASFLLQDATERTIKGIEKRAVKIDAINRRIASRDPEEPGRIAERLQKDIDEVLEKYEAMVAAVGTKHNVEVMLSGDGFKNLDEAMGAKAQLIINKMEGHYATSFGQAITDLVSRKSIPEFIEIDPTKVWSNGRKLGDYIEDDGMEVLKRMGEGLYADTQIYRAFGTVNPMRSGSKIRNQILNEFAKARQKLADEGKDVTKFGQIQRRHLDELERMFRRTQGLEGISADPGGMAYRAGSYLRTYNLYRVGGKIWLASAVDMARISAAYGMNTIFRGAFDALRGGLQGIKMTRKLAADVGAAVELTEPIRAKRLYDANQEVLLGSVFNKAMSVASNAAGRIQLFDFQNQGMKVIAAGFAQTHLMRNLTILTEGAGKRKLNNAAFQLAKVNIDGAWAERILNQMHNVPGGSEVIRGVRLPNLENWTDLDAASVYKAAVAQMTDDVVLTPSLELHKAFDSNNPAMRVLLQFRRFSYSSVRATWQAWGQNMKYQPVGVLLAIAQALALGMIQVYVRAWLAGKAMNLGWDEVIDRSIDYSGLLTVFGEPRQILGHPRLFGDYLSFAGQNALRGQHTSPFDQILGVGMGTARGAEKLVFNFGDPKRSNWDSVRPVLPLQNAVGIDYYLSEMQRESRKRMRGQGL